jgi:hypothetical protein
MHTDDRDRLDCFGLLIRPDNVCFCDPGEGTEGNAEPRGQSAIALDTDPGPSRMTSL